LVGRDDDDTRLQYDSWGHVTRKESPDEVIDVSYDRPWWKPTIVRRTIKSLANTVGVDTFQYDLLTGNLVDATTAFGEHLVFQYNDAGLINRLKSRIDGDIVCNYDSESRLVRISLEQEGKPSNWINVDFDPSGHVAFATSNNRSVLGTILKVLVRAQRIVLSAFVTDGESCDCRDTMSGEKHNVEYIIGVTEEITNKLAE